MTSDLYADHQILLTVPTRSSSDLRDLTLVAALGDITLTGAVGVGADNLNVLTVTSGAITTFGSTVRANDINITSDTTRFTDNVTALTDDIAVTGNVMLLGDVTLTAGGDAGDDITFAGTVDGGQSLTLVAGVGNITFNGIVGGVIPICF